MSIVIIDDQFTIGYPATVRCRSDNHATNIEWLTSNGMILESQPLTQQLDLVFSPVNESIHNNTYICKVYRNSGVQYAEENITVRVEGKKSLNLIFCYFS